MGVGEDLDLDVARVDHEALDEDRVVAERVARFATRRLELRAQLGLVANEPHALAPTPG